MKWENFPFIFQKILPEIRKLKERTWKIKLKTLETRSNFVDNPEYAETNEKLGKIYQEKTNGIRIRSKYNWYKNSEKFSNFFLNLGKFRAVQNKFETS